MQIHRQHTMGAGLRDQIGHQLGADRRPRSRFPVLPRVTEIGNDGRDPPGRGAAQRVQRDQQLHQIVVGRKRCRLHHENIFTTHVFLDLDKHLHIGEPSNLRQGQRKAQGFGDGLG